LTSWVYPIDTDIQRSRRGPAVGPLSGDRGGWVSGGEVDGVEVGALSVTIKDGEDLDWSSVGGYGVRGHGGELCGLARLHQDDAVTEIQPRGAGQHREPVPARVDAQLARRLPGRDAHLRDGHPLRPVVPGEQPGGHPVRPIAPGPDDHVVVIDGLHELIERGAQGAGERDQLVDGDAPVPGLDPTQRRRAHVTAGGEHIKRPPAGETKASYPGPDHTVEVWFLRHQQDGMPFPHGRPTVISMSDHHHATHVHPDDSGDAALAELLDLDGEVLHRYWTDVLTWVQQAVADAGPGRILDLGAGTGVGAVALAQRFAGAEVIAVDNSELMLGRIRAKALDLGLAPRIHTVRADLNDPWPAVEPVDVTWASMSLHHLADPDRVLSDVFATTRPGGLVAVAEMSEPLRFRPDDVGLGRPGLEARCLDALKHEHAQALPDLGSDWAPRLQAAGFTALRERTFSIALDSPLPPDAARYAQQWLRRLSSGIAGRLAGDDVDALARLVAGDGPESVQHGHNLRIRGTRTVTIGGRP
jgi:ubiquinone/menaquinone biosynthesis C-methylase UbiE